MRPFNHLLPLYLSPTPSQTIQKPVIAKETKSTAEDYLQRAKILQKKIVLMHRQLQKDPSIKKQLDLLKQGNLYFPNEPIQKPFAFLATDDFIHLVEDFKKAFDEYEHIKNESISKGFINQADIDQIEKSLQTRTTMHFFPQQQFLFDKGKNVIEAKRNIIVEKEKHKIDLLKKEYTKRSEKFKQSHAIYTLLSFMLVGIPFLIMNLQKHSLDKKMTKKEIVKLEQVITKTNKKASDKINQLKTIVMINVKKSEPSTQFKQGFFTLSKLIKTNEVREIAKRQFLA